MVGHRSRAEKERTARLGRTMYARKVRRKLRREKKGRVVALDVYTGDYEVADEVLQATSRLLERRPDAEIWLERVGYPTLEIMRGRFVKGVV